MSCSGYRDAQALFFKDETAAVKFRAEKRGSRKSSPDKPIPDTDSYFGTSIAQFHGSSIVRGLVPGAETIATVYFLETHVLGTSFMYLPRYWSSIGDDDVVKAAMLPTALAAFACSSQQLQLLHQARTYYSIALAATNKALGTRELVTLKSTLLSVLLLSMFEALTFRGQKSPQNWNAHVNGLTTILQMRGDHQFFDELDANLFNHASFQILASCVMQAIPVPRHLRNLQLRAVTLLGYDDANVRMVRLLDGIAMLKANMRGMLATEVVREIMRLNQFVLEESKDLKATEPYRVLTCTKCKTYGRGSRLQHHQYPSVSSARQWCNIRLIRLSFDEWIFYAFDGEPLGIIVNSPSHHDPLNDSWNQLRGRVTLDFLETLDEILASVPCSHGGFKESCTRFGRYLTWVLARAAASKLCPQPAKRFIITHLRAIGEQSGLEQAKHAAEMLEEDLPLAEW